MTNIKNFRQLANGIYNQEGKKIKSNMIFRSGELSKASTDDIQEIIDYGIKTIYDLRNPYEQQIQINHPQFEIYGFNISQSTAKKRMQTDFLMELANSDVEAFMISLYRDYLALSPVLKPLFKQLIHERKPFVFHCSAGKDRTGVVGALIMSLLNFEKDAIIHEYLTIDPKILEDAINSQINQGLSEEIIHKIKPLSGVNQRYLDVFFDTIISKYKSIENYYDKFLELTEEGINQFRAFYLE